MKVEDKDKVRVYNEGTLIGIQSDDGLWIEKVPGAEYRLYTPELFGMKGHEVDRVSLWGFFIPCFLEGRLYPKDRVGLSKKLAKEMVASRMDLGLKWNFRAWDDEIEIEVPNEVLS